MKAQRKISEVAPKNNVVFFPNCEPQKAMIPLPVNARPLDRFSEVIIDDDALSADGILSGDRVTLRINFSVSEITPQTFCYARILSTEESFLCRINTETETVNIFGVNYPIDDVEVLGIAVEVRKTLKQ